MGVSIPEGAKFERMVKAFEIMAAAKAGAMDLTDFRQIQSIVQRGLAPSYFSIGDQIVTTWNDGSNDYQLPWDVVAFRDVETMEGDIVPGMFIQSHYALQGVQFDGNEAFYVPAAEMAAGVYYFTIGNNWGNNCVAGKIYEFTTTQKIPAGGQLVIGTASSNTSGLPDTAPANWRVRTYSTGAQETPTEILTLTEVASSSGTDLGTLSSSTVYGTSGINNMQRAAYGYNRWSQSAIRQYLNSAEAAGAWWQQKNPFDHRPDQLASVRGFMAGLPAEFLSVVKPVKVVTALNTVTDAAIGASEITYDRFFCASLQEEFISPQANNVEGAAYPYWQERLGGVIHGQGTTRPEHIRYAYENHASAQYVRLRSANRGTAVSAWHVYSSGHATVGSATTANRPAPACVIC